MLIAASQANQTNEPRCGRSPAQRAAIAILVAALTAGLAPAKADSEKSSVALPSARLDPVDYNFVAQANLGAPFQIDSGRVAERMGTTTAIRDYAHLMVVTHIPVVDALNKILQQKKIEAPQNTLLQGAYSTMVASLNAEHGAAIDRDYVQGQVDYQKGNAALFRNEIQNGSDPDLKAFAQATLPKIEDHLERALKLAKDDMGAVRRSKSRQIKQASGRGSTCLCGKREVRCRSWASDLESTKSTHCVLSLGFDQADQLPVVDLDSAVGSLDTVLVEDAVDLAVKAVSDEAQWGVADHWKDQLETLESDRGTVYDDNKETDDLADAAE